MKENDWIVANINNPEFTASDFKNILGLNLDNTLLLPLEEYLKSDYILNNDLFKDSNGKFSKDIFLEYYGKYANKFNSFQEESSLDNYEYGFWDITLKQDSRVRNPKFNLDIVKNPDHISTGVIGPTLLGEKIKSPMELAEKLRIYDYTEGKFREETPDDMTLLSNPVKFMQNLLSDPLVMALYEEDEIDLVTGEKHYKGDYKLNEDGEYYFETLGGRSLIGKKVLSLGDIISKEDSYINKYDFFDSDGLDKNTTGVIAKNLAAVAPMILLGPTGTTIYSGLYVARELLKSLPMLSKMVGLVDGNFEDSKLLNNLAGIGEKFTAGISEHSKNSTFSLENFGNLISDVALQWGLQRFIANSINKISGNSLKILKSAEGKAMAEYKKLATNIWNRSDLGILDKKINASLYTGANGIDDIERVIASGNWKNTSVGAAALLRVMPEAEKAFSKSSQIGQDLSLVYMAIISNTDVYNSAIEHGATKKEAAALALGSTLGMFSVDKYAHLGEIFFDETPEKLALRGLRQGIKEEQLEIISRLGVKEAINDKKGLLGLINKGKQSAINAIKKYESGLKNHTLGFFGKSFGEGLEEVSEEAVTDIVKSLYELAGEFGWVSLKDIGAWDNAFERYTMSFLGGSIGGGLFYGIDAIKNPKSLADKEILKELLYLVSLNKTNEILSELDKLYKEGKLGSKSLSTEKILDDLGNTVFLSANNDRLSQNDFVYNLMKNSILLMDSIINGNKLNLTDDQLFERLVLSNLRFIALKNSLFDKSYITLYYDDYQDLVNKIFNVEKNIQDLEKSTSDPDKKNGSEYQGKLLDLLKLLTELLKYKEDFMNGVYNLDYVDKMLFYIHPEVSSFFYSALFEDYVENNHHKKVDDLTEGEKKKYLEEWENLKKDKGKEYLNIAFNLYKNTRGNIEKGLLEFSNDDIQSWGRILSNLKLKEMGWDDRIPKAIMNIDNYLNALGIIKSEEYDKPWKSDPTKSNKAFDLTLKEDSSKTFQIVKDIEDGYWSIHFKTGDRPTLNDDLKLKLFKAAAAIIPEGDKLSTYGELTKGGVSGINRFGLAEFIGGIVFNNVGKRKVKLKASSTDFSKLSDEDLLEVVLNYNLYLSENESSELDQNLYDLVESANKEVERRNNSIFDEVKGKWDSSSYIRGSEASDKYLQEIEIPIWQKTITGESLEDYESRDNLKEGESEEDFKNRRKARRARIQLYNNDHLIDLIRLLVNSNSMIDRGTERELITTLGNRYADLLKIKLSKINIPNNIVSTTRKKAYNDILIESLLKLKEDLSNRDEIVLEILTKTEEIRNLEFDEKYSHRLVALNENLIDLGTEYNLDGITLSDISIYDLGRITLNDLVESIDTNFAGKIVNAQDLSEFLLVPVDIGKSNYLNSLVELASFEHNKKLDPELLEDEYIALTRSELSSDIGLNELDESSGENIITENLLLNETEYNKVKNQHKEVILSILEKLFNDIIDNIESDKDLSTIRELKKKTTLDLNPFVKVMKLVLPKLGEDFGDIEQTLEDLYNLFNSLDIPTNFTLSQKLVDALKKASLYMNYTQAVVKSAKEQSDYFNFLPYNKSINEFIRENRSVIKDVLELLELDDDIAKVIEESLSHYRNEILRWVDLSLRGSINKRKMFSDFDTKFNKARLDFFKQILDLCKFGDKDLMRGFTHIDIDKPDAVVEIEKLIYNNFKQLNWKISEFLLLLDKQVNLEKVLSQKSNISYALNLDNFALSDYDKFIYLSAITCGDPVDFYTYYKKLVKNNKSKTGQTIAPLTFLEFNIFLGYQHKNGYTLINNIFREYLNSHNVGKVNFVPNTLILTGIGGSGKTDVIVRSLKESENVWISGPSSTQIDNLQSIITNAKPFSKKELFNEIIGLSTYSEIIKEVQEATAKKEESRKNSYNGKYINSNLNSENVTLKDGIKFNTKDTPKLLVIDEITLFSSVEILILSKWAEDNNIELILAGDNHLNGDTSIGDNIDRIFSFKVPEMRISLRDSNIWKYNNLKNILNIIDDLVDDKLSLKQANEILSSFNFSYFLNDSTFTGELVTTQLPNVTFKGTIAFIGDTSSEIYQKLKGKNLEVKVFDSVESILGDEFDYVISDIDLNFNKLKGVSEEFSLVRNLKHLYTLITRSKIGTIIIDNGLTETILGSHKENYSTENVGITPEASENYVKQKTAFLDSLNLERIVPVEAKEEPELEKTEVIKIPEEKAIKEEPSEPEVPYEDPPEEYYDLTIIPAFGSFNLSGLIKTDDGKFVKHDSNTDLGIFLNDDDIITVLDRPLNLLFLLKSIIMFDNIGSDYWYNKLDIKIRTLLGSLDNLKNLEYYVVAEDYDANKHKLLTKEAGLSDSKLGFEVNGQKKVFLIKARFNTTKGPAEITLGSLADPTNLLKNADDTKSILTDRINNTSNEELKKKISDYRESYERKIEYYRDTQLPNLMDRGRIRINKPYFDKCTRILIIKDEHGNHILRPLNEYFDKNTSLYVVSPVYTQINFDGDVDLYPGLEDALKGKPVIFVSSNKLLSPSELMAEYISLKANPDTHNPTVRKLVLTPKGVTFEELVNHKVKGMNNSEELKFPFSNTAVGFKMYMSLWNFRAAINTFSDKVEDYLKKNNLSKQDILKLAIEEASAYDGSENFRNSVTPEVAQKFKPLWDLNDYLDNENVPLFRVGYNEVSGFYSRTIKGGNGIYINLLMAEDYKNVINTLFTNVIDKILPPPPKSVIKSFIEKTDDFDAHTSEDTWVRKIHEGRTLNINLKTEDTNEKIGILVKNVELLRSLPLVLVRIALNINSGQNLSGGIAELKLRLIDSPSDLSNFIINLKNGDLEEELDYLSITDELVGGLLTTSVDGNTNTMPGVVEYSSAKHEGVYDRRIMNFFNLVMHGRSSQDDGAPADGTIFKYGIFVDTFVINNEVDKNLPFKASSTNRELYMTDGIPGYPVLKISLDEFREEDPKRKKKTTNEQENTLLKNINQIFGKNYRKVDTDKLDRIIVDNISKINTNSTDNGVLNTIIGYTIKDDNITVTTVEDFIKLKTGLTEVTAFSATQSETSTIYTFNGEYSMSIKDGLIEIFHNILPMTNKDFSERAKEIFKDINVDNYEDYVDDVEDLNNLIIDITTSNKLLSLLLSNCLTLLKLLENINPPKDSDEDIEIQSIINLLSLLLNESKQSDCKSIKL